MSKLVRRLLIVTAAAGAAAASAPAVQAASVTAGPSLNPVNTTVQTQGIIMRDGGVCDPIRHMGC